MWEKLKWRDNFKLRTPHLGRVSTPSLLHFFPLSVTISLLLLDDLNHHIPVEL